MKRPEDFPQQCRFYTGLYSTKAFNVIRKSVCEHSAIWGMYVVRALDGEVVVACSDTVIYQGGRQEVDREWLRDKTCECLGRSECDSYDTYNDRPKDDDYLDYAALRCFFLGKSIDPDGSFAKRLEKLRGKRRDDVAAELVGCQEEEERKVKAEYDRFMEAFERRYKFPTAKQIVGTYGTFPVYVRKELMGEWVGLEAASLADKTVTDEFLAAEEEMRKANNQLEAAFNAFDAAAVAYAEKRRAFKASCTEIKNRKIKAVANEFRAAKRTP